MKAYTDIEQSKVLNKILPSKSADMTYCAITEGVRDKMSIKGWKVNIGLDIAIKENLFSYRNGFMLPCWSLAALLAILPSPLRLSKMENLYWCNGTDDYDNPIDACYEMIIKLNELKML